jgi:hypothetical protein
MTPNPKDELTKSGLAVAIGLEMIKLENRIRQQTAQEIDKICVDKMPFPDLTTYWSGYIQAIDDIRKEIKQKYLGDKK